MFRFIKWLIFIVFFGSFLLIASMGVGLYTAYHFWVAASSTEKIEFAISAGESLDDVSARLKDIGAINNVWLFKQYAKISGQWENVQAGTVAIAPGDNFAAIIGALLDTATGDIKVTVPEGLTIKQMGVLYNEKLGISVEDWINATIDKEGYLFPDTYRFAPGSTAEEVVKAMADNMQMRLIEADAASAIGEDNEYKNIHELLTMASIIEREVRQPETMKMVSDIFRKRLAIGMALQADSTVNYITGGDDPSVSLADTKIDSPYNTYKYPGLPPGPISNPGLNAITAAAHPTENAYYYFLTTDAGEVYYAATHDQHVANKQKYLR